MLLSHNHSTFEIFQTANSGREWTGNGWKWSRHSRDWSSCANAVSSLPVFKFISHRGGNFQLGFTLWSKLPARSRQIFPVQRYD